MKISIFHLTQIFISDIDKAYHKKHPYEDEYWPQTPPGVNFINILCSWFLYESKFWSFFLITFGFVIFGAKIWYKKCSRKTLMKLTAEVRKQIQEHLEQQELQKKRNQEVIEFFSIY